jgi:hypothetical protein
VLQNGEDPRPAKGAVREVYDAARAAKLDYSPAMDGDADPGEVVWAWVPFEEDANRGKDRPLLVVGHAGGGELLALMLSSKEPREDHLELGAGAWDRDGRPSYLRLDRVFALDEDDIRREGAVLGPAAFGEVVDALRKRHGWR